jgi:phosphatidylserine/phosphatidylglycerophosphate/cardiolipin synthase-like enzyme
MTSPEFATFLEQTLQDKRLSRNERQVMTALAAEPEQEAALKEFRRLAFHKAAEAIDHPGSGVILDWLADVLKALEPRKPDATANLAEACFSPQDDCCQRVVSFLQSAKRSLEICVFTITDDRITRAVLDAHRRGVALRVLTDNEKAEDLGSDIEQLRQAGVALRVDDSPAHMHHKFAVADRAVLLNGSFNWTRSASLYNEENFILSGDPRLITAFSTEFERLWQQFGPSR